MPFTADLTAARAALDDLKRLVDTDRAEVLRVGGEAAGVAFDRIVRNTLPPSPRKQPQAQRWTKKQTRWWWATMHKKAVGQSRALPGWRAAYKTINGVKTLVIDGAYKRTGKGVQSLTYDVVARPREVTVFYGTNRAYMRYVIDLDNQAEYHEGNWDTLQGLAETHIDAVSAAFGDAVVDEMKRRYEQG